jgi:glutathione synthase/RimK-type ligase-like ATP-grasp enzyme
MDYLPLEIADNGDALRADRIGFAKLAKLAFDGCDLQPMLQQTLRKIGEGTASAGETIDLSVIAQLLGNKQAGLDIQSQVLSAQRLFRSPCASAYPSLRVLALAAAMDVGGNTPIEFLVEDFDIELTTLYVVPGAPLPPLPDHDVAIVVASDSEECRDALKEMAALASRWPRPLLNTPDRIGNLDRDKLCRLLTGVPGLEIPQTLVASRVLLEGLASGAVTLGEIASDLAFPVIVRPRGSHAGLGLAKIDDRTALTRYLPERNEEEFFISPFVDYSDADGQFRKYRLAFVEGRPFAGHMAIAEQWNIWYLNAGMAFSAEKRREEERFMRDFDVAFARRHHDALRAIADRVGLDYFTIDCAENKRGELLLFEADNTAVVHNMDSPDLFPYKPPHMQMIFDAFARMLRTRARDRRERAA